MGLRDRQRQRQLTDAEFEQRLGENLQQEGTAEGLRAEIDRMQELTGAVSFIQLVNIDEDSAGALGIGRNGTTGQQHRSR